MELTRRNDVGKEGQLTRTEAVVSGLCDVVSLFESDRQGVNGRQLLLY